ncbi:MAG: O-Antigen ligase [Actinomycetota bacterium]|nr:O-Antigen ligase [Actinomycetota bacterium]
MSARRVAFPPALVNTGLVGAVACLAAVSIVASDRLGQRQQLLLAATVLLGSAAVVLFVWRPSVVVNGYVLAIPLLVSASNASAVNPGIAATLAVVLLGLPGLLLRADRIPKEIRSLAWPLAGLGLLGAISSIANGATSLGDLSNGSFKYFSFAAVLFLIFVHNNSEEKAAQLMKSLIGAAIIVALYSIFAYASGRSFYAQYGYSRASGTFENWNELGGYMALLVFPTGLVGLSSKARWVRRLSVGACALESIALLLSLTLGSVLAVLISCAFGLCIFFRRRLALVLLTLGLAAFVLLLVWHFVPALGQKFSATNSRVEDRFATYSVGLDAMRAHLWLGVGSEAQVLESVVSTPSQQPVSVVPHNSFIAIGVEKGIFGTILLALLVINAVRVLLHPGSDYGRFRLWHYGILLGVTAFLIQNMSNLLVLHSRLGVVWLAMLALDVRLRQLGSKRELPTAVLMGSGG